MTGRREFPADEGVALNAEAALWLRLAGGLDIRPACPEHGDGCTVISIRRRPGWDVTDNLGRPDRKARQRVSQQIDLPAAELDALGEYLRGAA